MLAPIKNLIHHLLTGGYDFPQEIASTQKGGETDNDTACGFGQKKNKAVHLFGLREP